MNLMGVIQGGLSTFTGGGGGGGTTLNPSDASSNLTISNGNLTETGKAATSQGNVRSTSSHSTGKYYWEFTISNTLGTAYSQGVGAANASASLTTGPGSPDTNSVFYYEGDPNIYVAGSAGVNTGVTYNTDGDVICVALDLTNNKIWFRLNGGNWNGSGTDNPATNTGGQSIAAITGPFYAFGGSSGVLTAAGTFNFGATAFAQTAPSGFGNF